MVTKPTDTKRQRRYGALALIVGLSLANLPVSGVAATSYLQELEAEAERSATVEEEANGTASEQSKPEWNQNAPADGETIDSGLTQVQFEEKLKESYYGSYLFYSTLDRSQQENVYQDYKRDNSINSIRESIKSNMKN